MSKSLQEIYRSKVFNLAKTLVFKSHETAVAVNNFLLTLGYTVDWYDPKTWKYYLNLSGQYHQYDHDKTISDGGYLRIKVAGNNGPIETNFTKELISNTDSDLGTAYEYTYGTPKYKELVTRYPDSEALILGILTPVDIDIAIKAPNYTILYCGGYYIDNYKDTTDRYIYTLKESLSDVLIESQEVNLISELQKYISLNMATWVTPDYSNVDNLYTAAMCGIIGAMLPITISNIRLANCRTNRVHSYHIQEYLEGYGFLGAMSSYVPLTQRLWLYRNIDYLTQNFGKQETFDSFIKYLLTPTNISLVGYKLKHTISFMPDEIYPRPVMEKDIINFKQTGAGNKQREIAYIINKEIPLARQNDYDIENVVEDTVELARNSQFSELKTKVLESVVIDYNDFSPYPLNDILMNMWMYTATQGTYLGTMYVTHPYTGERLQLSPLNALILMFYCFYKGHFGDTLKLIPDLEARFIPRVGKAPTPAHNVTPTLPTLLSYIDKTVVTSDRVQGLMSSYIPRLDFKSADSFNKECKLIHKQLLGRYYYIAGSQNRMERAGLDFAMRDFYWFNVPCVLTAKNTTYDSWLNKLGIDLTDLTPTDLTILAKDILVKGTGIKEDEENALKNLQDAVIGIMKHFSSYTVQYLENVIVSSPSVGDIKTIRMSYTNIRGYGLMYFPLGKINPRYQIKGIIRLLTPLNDYSLERRLVVQVARKYQMKTDIAKMGMGGMRIRYTPRVLISKFNDIKIQANS